MWWKRLAVAHILLLSNIIAAQPVIIQDENGASRARPESGSEAPRADGESVRGTRQAYFTECCPCSDPRDGDGAVNDQRRLATLTSEQFYRAINAAECPCRSAGADSEGAPSAFTPILSHGAPPLYRSSDQKADPKPLLRPEVGLASSVLETLQEATDEEYKEALARDAARDTIRTIETDLLDSEPQQARNLVTVVFSPKDNLNDEDTVSEASHVQETRCVHSPLRSVTVIERQRPYSKLPQIHSANILHKTNTDMEDSPSNIQERIVSNEQNDNFKLKTNPLFLNTFSPRSDEHDNFSNLPNSGMKFKTTAREDCNYMEKDIGDTHKPVSRLASLRNRLRDLSLIKSLESLNNNQQLSQKPNLNDRDSNVLPKFRLKSLIHNDVTNIDKHKPLPIKNILKLKDVELLSPFKTKNEVNNDIVGENMNHNDMKSKKIQQSENTIMNIIGDTQEDGSIICENNKTELDTVKNSQLEVPEPQPDLTDIISSPSEMHLVNSLVSNTVKTVGDARDESEGNTFCDISSLKNNTTQIESAVNMMSNEVINDINKFHTSDTSNEANSNDYDESLDKEVSQSSEQIILNSNEEAQMDINNTTDNELMKEEGKTQDKDLIFDESNHNFDYCDQNETPILETKSFEVFKIAQTENPSIQHSKNSRLSPLKESIKKKIEALQKTKKPKLIDIATTTSNIISDSNDGLLENTDANNGPKVNHVNMKNRNSITTSDLQKMSDSILGLAALRNQDLSSEKLNCDLNSKNSYNEISQDNKILPLITSNKNNFQDEQNDFDDTARLKTDQISPSLEDMSNTDYYISNTNLDQEGNDHAQNLNYRYEEQPSAEPYLESGVMDNQIIPNEMISEASNSIYNSVRSGDSCASNLGSSLLQDAIVQPSIEEDNFNLFKNPLQLPSLEDIRQGITDILDKGQREVEGSDTLNESSNIDSVRSSGVQKLPLSSRLKTFKLSRPDASSIRPTILGVSSPVGSGVLNLPTDTFDPRFTSDFLGKLPTLDDLSEVIKTRSGHLLEPSNIQIPNVSTIVNHLKLPSAQHINNFADNLKSRTETAVKNTQNLGSNLKEVMPGNRDLLSHPWNSEDLLQNVARTREDMNEKLEALHLDFNDRLESMHNRLRDQTNLQSISSPVLKENKHYAGPKLSIFDDARDSHKLFAPRTDTYKSKIYSKPSTSLFPDNNILNNNRLKPIKMLTPDRAPARKNNIKTLKQQPKKETNVFSYLDKFHPLKENRFTFDRQRTVKPFKDNSKVKISFSSTTSKPIVGVKPFERPSLGSHKPLNSVLQKDKKPLTRTLNKSILSANKQNKQSSPDPHQSPSDVTLTRIPVERKPVAQRESTNVQPSDSSNPIRLSSVVNSSKNNKPGFTTPNTPRRNVKQQYGTKDPDEVTGLQSTPDSLSTKVTENPIINNIKELLRSRYSNKSSTSNKSLQRDENNRVGSVLDSTHSPSDNVRSTSLVGNALKENTSYRCTMMCVKE